MRGKSTVLACTTDRGTAVTSLQRHSSLLLAAARVVLVCGLGVLLVLAVKGSQAQAGARTSVSARVAEYEASHDALGASYEDWNSACIEHLGVKVDIIRSGSTIGFVHESDAKAPVACIEKWTRRNRPIDPGEDSRRSQYVAFTEVSKCLKAQGLDVNIPTFQDFLAAPRSWHPYQATPLGHTMLVVGDPEEMDLNSQERLQLELQRTCPA